MSISTHSAMLAAALFLTCAPAWGGEVVQVGIDRNRFEPALVRVKPGSVVEWRNGEKRTSHSILFEGQEESDRLFPGESYRKSFDEPGSYRYRCGPHPEMVGIVEVVP